MQFQAVWCYTKGPDQLFHFASEVFRILKPGARFTSGDYVLNDLFDWNNEEHVRLHSLYLPTLAGVQSNHHKDLTAAFVRAGFKIIKSEPSLAPAWPLCDQKTDLFLIMREIIIALTYVGICPVWAETLVNNLLLGGQAWNSAEKMKLADMNWQLLVEKPGTG